MYEAINRESGEFIFCAYRGENEDGELIPFPKDIEINKLLKVIPKTTSSMLVPGKKYKDYSFNELKEMTKQE